ncbi:type VI secretion system tube protein TssD [Pedobacter aquatilis]|uniref:type VI secretion system tube protein TssD n=1 Tax=Pedobacter aquatilis TaxID=351343 RepID=UPI00292F9A3E|nr:type VI secretion system tube protein TssD [Pedobacter aquatilis]
MNDTRTDIELVSCGSEEGFRIIFERYHQKVYKYARRYLDSQVLCEEVVQEVFIKIWSNRSKFQFVENFGAYIRKISINCTIAKNLPDEILKLMAAKKSNFDGTITISDSYGKLLTRTIKFSKASLYSFSDQYSSSYYGDSIGNVAISLSCNSISINGVTIEQ